MTAYVVRISDWSSDVCSSYLTLDGILYQSRGCADNGTVFPQSKIYTDSTGAYVCNPVVDQNAKTVALQSRIQITVNSLSQYITDCTPDTSTLAVQVTTEDRTSTRLNSSH